MRALLLAATAVLLFAPATAEEPPAGGGDAGAPPPAVAKAPPKDPPAAVAKRIDEALQTMFTGSHAARTQARSAIAAALGDWRDAAKDDPLRAVSWWRSALERTLPAGAAKKTGIHEEKIPYVEGKDAQLWVSVPKAYSPKNLHALVVTLVEKGADPRRVWSVLYGDLLKDTVVVGIPMDSRAAGFDVGREPWHVGLGIKHAVETYRIDRDRVFLDGPPAGSGVVAAIGAEWAVHFAGVILRAPRTASPLVANLGLPAVLIVDVAAPPEAGVTVAEKIRAAAPSAKSITVEDPANAEDGAAEVQAWLRGVARRALPSAGDGFAWSALSAGGETWAYWLWVFRAVEAKAGRPVTARVRWDRAANRVHITSENLAEGILLVNDSVLDLDRPVAVVVNGHQVWSGEASRGLDTALYWIGQTGERPLFAPAEIRFAVPREAQVPPADAAAPGDRGAPAPAGDGGAPAAPPAVPADAPIPPQTEDEEGGRGDAPPPAPDGDGGATDGTAGGG